MSKNYKAIFIIICIASILLSLSIFFLTKRHYELKYSFDRSLQKKYDSLSIILSIKKAELDNLNGVYDSIKKVSASQTSVLDSLLLSRKNKRNEKPFKPISSIPDDEVNSILSDRLK